MMSIEEYLQVSTDYSVGLTLLEAVAPKNRMLSRLKQGDNSYNRQKLRQLLRNYRNMPMRLPEPPILILDQEQPKISKPNYEAATERGNSPEMLYPQQVSTWIKERAQLVRQRDKVSNSLLGMATNQERAEGRQKIDDLQSQVKNLTERIEDWKRTGKVEEEKTTLTQDEQIDLRRRLNNAKSNLTKKRKALNKWISDVESDERHRRLQISKYQSEVKKYEELVGQLREELA